MAKELYIYTPIYSYAAEVANKELSKVKDSEDLTFRINSPGGEVSAGFAIISKLSERKSKTNAIIDGQAKSMGAYMLVFFDHVVANDTSELMFHKAAYAKWYEPTQQEQESLDRMNSIFEQKVRAKVSGKPGAEAFLSKLFEKDKRNDIEITPAEALALGIVDEVRTLEPKAFYGAQICAMFEEGEAHTQQKEDHTKIKNMTIEELQSKYPALYAQVFNAGVKQGQTSELDRTQAWAVFAEIDPKAVKEGIESGKPISQKAMSEFALKQMKTTRMEDHKDDNAEDTDTGKDKKTAEELKAEADKKAMDAEFEKHFPSKN